MTDEQTADDFFSDARVSARSEAVELGTARYQDYLFALDDEKLAPWRGMGYEEFTAARQDNPFLQQLLADWNDLYEKPFTGVTSDGHVIEDLYSLPDTGTADPAVVAAARAVLDALPPDQRSRVSYPLDAPQWRAWSNPEFVFHRVGIRLEDQDEPVTAAVHELLAAALSPEGYERVAEAMRLNAFLGELVDLPSIMNDRSYWFALYGTPAEDEPWGFQIFGHHLALHFVTVGGRDIIAPLFIGAEPALTGDALPPIFDARERLALELAASFTPEQRARAVVYDSVLHPAMPEGRLHPADERHVAGAFHDNRVVPYEGIPVRELDAAQRDLLRRVIEDVHLLLTADQRAATLAEYDAHLDETYLAWYGATDGSQPIYFRVHSPVILAELDNHAGVWLNNQLPARFHVHSTLRLPNGNDYGKASIARWSRP